MMQPEEKIAYFPQLLVEGDFATEEYGMLVTSRRLIFVITKKTYLTTVGMIYDTLKNPKAPLDKGTIDLNLSTDKRNFAIWNTQLSKIDLKKKLLSHRLDIYYITQYGNERRLKSSLLVPTEFYSDMRKLGKPGKEIPQEYAALVRDALLKVSPPNVAMASQWTL